MNSTMYLFQPWRELLAPCCGPGAINLSPTTVTHHLSTLSSSQLAEREPSFLPPPPFIYQNAGNAGN